MGLQPIERKSLARTVAARLVSLIVKGELKPGQRVPSERILAEQLEVSRTTVREALDILAAFNVIETLAARGTFVKDVGVDPVGYDQGLRDLLEREGFDMPSVHLINPAAGVDPAATPIKGISGISVPPKSDPERRLRLPNLKTDRLGTFDFISWWERDTVRQASVMVVGAGALGNEVLKNLSLMGIGKLFIVDFDNVEAANLSRSILFREEDNGLPKAEIAARRIKELNPDVQVQYFQGDITTELGLGVFRRMDGIVGCLDNREARLAVNRFAHWLDKPWVDGAIQELLGLVRVFAPGEGACYECTLTEQARREMSLRYSCPLLARHNILLGKVPTTPTISSIIGAMQSQEVLKLLHDMPVEFGTVTHFNGLTNEMHTSAYVPRDDCESHWTYGNIVELPGFSAGRTTLAEILARARADLGSEAVLELDQEIVLTLDCPNCHTSTEVFRPLTRVDFDEGLCPACGQLRQVNMTHVITGDEPFLDRTLRSIGVPALHVVRARSATEYRFYELTGDLAEALHFAHFGAAQGIGEGAAVSSVPVSVRRPRPRVRLGDPLPEPRPRVKLGK
jgi:molybdopterin/thiamine biosynthesis adenylyltransferase/DNA-binding transcriptional regulator YhcF (GntR family)